MKLKMKLMAAAVALAAASGANAAIDNGNTTEGAGELFFNIWDTSGSYTLDLNLSINSFQSLIAAPGAIDLVFAADPLFGSFMDGTSAAGARSGTLKFNVTANDGLGSGAGARRTFQTFTEPAPIVTIGSGVARNANGATLNFANAVSGVMGANNSVAVDSASAGYAGKAAFKDTAGTFLNFSNAGTLANNSYASGLSFMSIGANSIGTSASTYTQLLDSGSEIHVYLDNANALHISAVAAIPEPSEYALMLAGLGMLGFMARRRLNNRA